MGVRFDFNWPAKSPFAVRVVSHPQSCSAVGSPYPEFLRRTCGAYTTTIRYTVLDTSRTDSCKWCSIGSGPEQTVTTRQSSDDAFPTISYFYSRFTFIILRRSPNVAVHSNFNSINVSHWYLWHEPTYHSFENGVEICSGQHDWAEPLYEPLFQKNTDRP